MAATRRHYGWYRKCPIGSPVRKMESMYVFHTGFPLSSRLVQVREGIKKTSLSLRRMKMMNNAYIIFSFFMRRMFITALISVLCLVAHSQNATTAAGLDTAHKAIETFPEYP